MSAQAALQGEKTNDQKEESGHDGASVECCEMGDKQVQLVVQQFMSLNVQNTVVQPTATMSETRGEGEESEETSRISSTGFPKLDHRFLFRRRMRVRKERRKYDRKGRLLCNGIDVCHCLQIESSGCFYPCPRCTSNKGGAKCYCNRRWVLKKAEDHPGVIVNTFSSTFPH